MGIHGLWSLLDPVGKPVTLESLQGKTLAVDVSMWLHQSMKGMRDRQGNALHNAHLQVLFNRVCKLLFYQIKPVFVFDGGVPALKRQTLAVRRQKRHEAVITKEQTTKKLLQNVLKYNAVSTVLGNPVSDGKLSMVSSSRERDIFELQPLPEADRPEELDVDNRFDDEAIGMQQQLYSEFQNLEEIDIESGNFKSLPPDIRHEILSNLKETRKQNSWAKLDELPTDSLEFSGYQMKKLLKQSNLSQKIEHVRKEINASSSGEIVTKLTGDKLASEVISSRVASDDTTHYIFVKGMSKIPENLQQETFMANSQAESSAQEVCISNLTDNSLPLVESKTEFVSPTKQKEDIMDCGNNMEKENDLMSSDDLKNLNSSKQNEDSVGYSNIEEKGTDMPCRDILESSKQNEVRVLEGKTVEKGDVLHSELFSCKLKQPVYVSENQETIDLSEMEETVPCKRKKTEISLLAIEKQYSEDQQQSKMGFSLQNNSTSHRNPQFNDLETDDIKQSNNFISHSLIQNVDKKTVKLPQRTTRGIDSYRHYEIGGTIDNNQGDSNSVTHQEASSGNINLQKEDSDTDTDDFVEVNDISNGENFKENEKFSSNVSAFKSIRSETEIDTLKVINSSDQQDDLIGQAQSTSHPANDFGSVSTSELEDLKVVLEEESATLMKETGKMDRLATSITDQVQKEAQELLHLFGVPYVISPMEAEAQCAFLDLTDQTNGTITDDSDVWLFGGKKVYKNFFNQKKQVKYFNCSDIEKDLLLNRKKLINLAYLCGCDYTDGIAGIGPITALEILLEFPGEGIEGLESFKTWWDDTQAHPKIVSETKLKSKLRTLNVAEAFPNKLVLDAFLHPEVDESEEKFTWTSPDLDLLRDFACEKLGWTRIKIDEVLLPVVKNMNKNENNRQLQITNFFTEARTFPVKSKRVKRVLDRMKDKSVNHKDATKSEVSKGKSSKKLPAKNSRKKTSTKACNTKCKVNKQQNVIQLSEDSDSN